MWYSRVIRLLYTIFCLLIVTAPDFILGLKDVSVTVPTAVRKGDNALLICNYDMEGDILYSVKWYKGRREFYRYTPKENPAMKTFTVAGINVERTLSNQSHVVLSSVQLGISGKFSCEVSADAPSFHTVIVSGDMEVVEIPEQRPSLTGVHSRYRLSDTINGNCTSYYSKPAANLTWTINDIPALPHQIKIYPIEKNPTDNLETSVVEINLLVTPQHFIRGRLKLKCVARIHGIYEQDAEKLIEEDRPRILASGRSPDVNLFPYDQQADGELNEQNELYLTHYKDTSSSATSLRTIKIINSQYSTILQNLYKKFINFDIIFYSIIFLSYIISNNLNDIFSFIKILIKFIIHNSFLKMNKISQNTNNNKELNNKNNYRIYENNNYNLVTISKQNNEEHEISLKNQQSTKNYHKKCNDINDKTQFPIS